MRLRTSAQWIVLMGLAAFAPLCGQTATGTIQGVVQDSSGAVVPQASVHIINAATGVTKALATDAAGRYVEPFLQPGVYAITASKQGFETIRQQNVKLDVAQNLSVNLVLTVGAVSQQVLVEATPPPVDANTSTLGQVVENKRIIDLPLNGRSVFNLAQLTPGVNPSGGRNNSAGGGFTVAIGGGRVGTSEIQIDGISNGVPDGEGMTQFVSQPQVDAVAEFSVQTNALSAEYGRFGGGVINVATKSGTNQVHGTAYEFLRNSVMDANNFFSNRNGIGKASYKRNQFGGTIGGPVFIPKLYDGRNKTFFFFGYESNLIRQPAIDSETVPIDPWRKGDFSNLRNSDGDLITVYDPLTVRPDPANPGNYIRSPFTGNRIPTDRLNPVAVNMMKYYAEPNAAPSDPYTQADNFYFAGTRAPENFRADTRVDQNWNDKWRTFARISFGWNQETRANAFGNPATPFQDGNIHATQDSASLDNTYAISPTLLANVRYGFDRLTFYKRPLSDGFDNTKLGFPASFEQAGATRGLEFPNMWLDGVVSQLGQGGYDRQMDARMTHVLTGSLTKITSRHNLKFGGEYRKMFYNYSQPGYPTANFDFDAGWTQQEISTASDTQGSPIASFLLGLPLDGIMTHDTVSSTASSYFAGYLQDDFKVTSRLTLNLGLRYEVERPKTERYNALSYFDLNAPSPLAGKVSASACPACGNLKGAMQFVDANNRRQTPTDTNNFGPRVGFAFDLRNGTVLRGGYGIIYAPSMMQANITGMEGFASATTFIPTLDNGITIKNTLSNPFPDGYNWPKGRAGGPATDLGLSVEDSLFVGYRNPYIQEWNFNIQQQLPGSLVLEVGYAGNRGIGLVDGDGGVNLNQLPASDMALKSQLNKMVTNPFYGLITDPNSSLSAPEITYAQLLRPYPQYEGLDYFRQPTGDSIYHALNVRVDKRFSHGFGVLLSYTAGKLIDDASHEVSYLGPIAGSKLDSYNLRLERSISSLDVSQRFVGSYLYELPFGSGKRFLAHAPKPLRVMVSGWQANGITTFSTGVPLIVSQSRKNSGIFSGQRPDNNGHSAYVGGGTTDQRIRKWFDTSVFSLAPSYTLGNTPRTLPDVRAPGLCNTDLSLFKNTYIGPEGRLNLQFRLEAFNALNTPQFRAPNTAVGSAAFGRISATSVDPRQLQAALKLIW